MLCTGHIVLQQTDSENDEQLAVVWTQAGMSNNEYPWCPRVVGQEAVPGVHRDGQGIVGGEGHGHQKGHLSQQLPGHKPNTAKELTALTVFIVGTKLDGR